MGILSTISRKILLQKFLNSFSFEEEHTARNERILADVMGRVIDNLNICMAVFKKQRGVAKEHIINF